MMFQNDKLKRLRFGRTGFLGMFLGVGVGLLIGSIVALLVAFNIVSYGVPFWLFLVVGGASGLVAGFLGWMYREIALIGVANHEGGTEKDVLLDSIKQPTSDIVLDVLSPLAEEMMKNDAISSDIHSLALILGQLVNGKIQLPPSLVQRCFCFDDEQDCILAFQLLENAMYSDKIKYKKFDKAFVVSGLSDEGYNQLIQKLNESALDKYSIISLVDSSRLQLIGGSIRSELNAFYTNIIDQIEDGNGVEKEALLALLRSNLDIDFQQTIASWLKTKVLDVKDQNATEKEPITSITVVGEQSASGTEANLMDRAMISLYTHPTENLNADDMQILLLQVQEAIRQVQGILGDTFSHLPSKHMVIQRVLSDKDQLDLTETKGIKSRHNQLLRMSEYFNRLKVGATKKEGETSLDALSRFEKELQQLESSKGCLPGMADIISRPWIVLDEIVQATSSKDQENESKDQENDADRVLSRFIVELDNNTHSLSHVYRFIEENSDPDSANVKPQDAPECILLFLSYLKKVRRLILVKANSLCEGSKVILPCEEKTNIAGDLFRAFMRRNPVLSKSTSIAVSPRR